MAIALRRLEEQERRARNDTNRFSLLWRCVKADAEKAEQTLNKYFKVKRYWSRKTATKQIGRKRGNSVNSKRATKPYRAVVSVLMLREGWDVPEVGVIMHSCANSAWVYGQQVVGRGLRRVRVKGVDQTEPQICAVVDHPKLEH